jgi:aryl-alcohol dehydrogenase-like predicted oxidoreductase
MEYTEIGPYRDVSRLGFGCWAIGGHGWGAVDDNESVAAVRRAYDLGITFYDTADVYGFGHSEKLLYRALGEHRKNVVIASKFGVRWNSSGKIWKDISPEYMRTALEASLRRLKLDCIPIYYIHWPDGKSLLSDTLGVMADCVTEGKIGAIGISNFSPVEVLEAHSTAPIQILQGKLNILEREALSDILPICTANHINFISWGSLADGLLTGKFSKNSAFTEDDHRNDNPNFQNDRWHKNLIIVEKLKELSVEIGVSVTQLAIRWLLDTPGVSGALVGSKNPLQIEENIGALDWTLMQEEYQKVYELKIN